jgi:hypothetical protein
VCKTTKERRGRTRPGRKEKEQKLDEQIGIIVYYAVLRFVAHVLLSLRPCVQEEAAKTRR